MEEEDGGNEGEGEDEDDEWVTRKSVIIRSILGNRGAVVEVCRER